MSEEHFEGEPGEAGIGFDRGGFVASARRWWWLLVLAATASGLMAYLIATRIPPTYTAETKLLVGPLNASEETIKAAQALTQTYAALVESDRVLQAATETSGVVGLSPETLRKEVSVSGNQTERILTIGVADENPEVAVRLARAFPTALTDFITEVESAGGVGGPGGQGTGTGTDTATTPTETTGPTTTGPTPTVPLPASTLEVIQPAQTATKSSGTSTTLIVVGAVIGGMIVALLIAVIADSFTTSVRDEDEVARLTGASVLGSVDGWRGSRRGGLVVTADPDSKAAVAYRLLAMKIEGMSGSAPPRTLVVVATESSDGGAELAANLAAVLASGDGPVTLLDLASRKDVQAVFHPNGTRPDRRPLRRATLLRHEGMVLERFRVAGQSLTVAFPRASLDALDRDGAQGLLDSLLEDTEMVVINAPPVDRSAATLALASAADATVLLARARRTNRRKVGPAADSLRMVGANLVGTVLRDSRAV
jgi:polysaccharide biosynthesis transport protein